MNFIPCTDVYYSDDCGIEYAGPYSVQQLFEYVSPLPSPQHQPHAQPQQAQSMPHDSWREQFYYRTKPCHHTLSNQQAYDFDNQYRYTWDVPLDQSQLYYPPLSPITPSDSPQYNYQPPNPTATTTTATTTTATASPYLPAMQYYAYDQQLPLAPEMYHSPLYDSSCDSSPMFDPPTSYQNEQDDDDEEEAEEEEEEEEDASVLPNAGNKELRGMGLYDTPELIDSSCCPSPVTPGKGLVLERSFGLPTEMMVKDEVSGKVVKRQVELEEEEGWPVVYTGDWGWP